MFKKIKSIIKVIFLTKKRIEIPSKSRIILYREEGKELLNKYIKENIIILDPSREINLVVLIKCLLKLPFNNLMLNYNRTFISMVNPKFIFTYIDNDIKFYLLKDFFREITFISIQNGYRGATNTKKYKSNYIDCMEGFNSVVSKVKKLKCDFILTFNKAVSKKYQKFIKTKTIVIGSIKNNIIKNKNLKIKKTLSFISEANIKKNFENLKYDSRYKMTWNDWLSAEQIIVPFLGNYCKKNNLKFQIIPKGNGKYEKLFYENLIQDKFKYTYLSKKNYFYGYESLNKSNYFVGINSSLAYEALSRKKKVVFLSIRKEVLNKKGFNLDFRQFNFGWPHKFKKKGLFWSHINSKKEFERVLNFLTKINDQKWSKLINNLSDDFKIPYNKNNSIFLDFLKNLKIKTSLKNI